jgi:hypothetical protein
VEKYPEFPEYLEQRYLRYQTDHGKRKTLDEFADWLGQERVLVSLYMSGKRKPGPYNIRRMALVLGLELYDVLHLPRPDEQFYFVEKNWEKVDPSLRARIAEEIRKYVTHSKDDDSDHKE